jgi:hypothetical protein
VNCQFVGMWAEATFSLECGREPFRRNVGGGDISLECGRKRHFGGTWAEVCILDSNWSSISYQKCYWDQITGHIHQSSPAEKFDRTTHPERVARVYRLVRAVRTVPTPTSQVALLRCSRRRWNIHADASATKRPCAVLGGQGGRFAE